VKSPFLGGAAKGTVYDNTTVIYNPASTSFIQKSAISVSANTVSLRIFRFKNGLGENVNMSNLRLSILPQLLAGVVTFKKAPKFNFGYMISTMSDFKSDFAVSNESQVNIVDSLPGAENSYSKYRSERRIIGTRAGFSFSYLLNKNISLGCGFIVALNSERFLNDVNVKISPLNSPDITYGSISSSLDFDYFHLRGVFKPSIALNYPRFRFGGSFTFPSFSIYGRGKITREISIYNIPIYPQNDYLFSDQKNKIKVNYRDPASISMSVAGKISKNSWLMFSGQYYFKLPFYYVFNEDNDVKSVPSGYTDEEIKAIFDGENFLSLKERRKQVLNLGVGYRHRFEDVLELMLGFRTDFAYSYAEDRYFEIDKIKITGAGLSSYYMSVGVATFGKKIQKFSLGLDFGFTTNVPTDQIVNLSNPTIDVILSDKIKKGSVYQYVIRLSLAIDLNLQRSKSKEEKSK
jgi:hypothetical protein